MLGAAIAQNPQALFLGGPHTKIKTPEGFWQCSAIDIIKKSIFEEVWIDNIMVVGKELLKQLLVAYIYNIDKNDVQFDCIYCLNKYRVLPSP